MAKVVDLQRGSTEPHCRRGRPPPQNSAPTAPPTPRRRRQETYQTLLYTHCKTGSPTSRRRSGRRSAGR
jgi:hypothetical protein